ncbi:polyketide cyclase [Rikenella microfusus]|uniref:polyketide cyclase n=1 Tax=Rikenella microfusus TaxID=28139 RepID=UPI001E0207BB|nr:polyketide cyclase [Rikenella microfusus]HJE88469.1 polyketide cyclase [Rikenella microfusus]
MRYTSKQVQIARPDETIFRVLSSFENFTPILADKVESWEATEETCKFKAKGFTVGLKMVERQPNKLIKVCADESAGGMPIPFTFWAQMKDTTPEGSAVPGTRMRIVLDIELNPMMKMIVGNKMQDAVDSIAEQIAYAFNNARF